MAKATPATKVLDSAKATYSLHTYEYDPSAQKVGMQAAEEMGVEPDRVLKTLMVLVDSGAGTNAACVLIPSNCELSMKKVAAAFGGKSAKMMPPAEAEKATGYKVGGISPLGRKKSSPVAVDELAMQFDEVFLNGGQRGLQVKIKPDELVRVLNAKVLSLVA